jgi:hypothetical protein
MKGIHRVLLGFVIIAAYAQTAEAQSAFNVGLNFSYSKGGYPYGGYPIGWGGANQNFNSLYNCFSSSQFMSAANAHYGPGYGPGNGFGPNQGMMMPPAAMLPALPPPMAYQPVPVAPPPMNFPGGPGPCGGGCMPPPPPCSIGCGPMNGGFMHASAYAGNGIFFGPNGQVIIDDRGIMEWEKNDTAGIVAATGGTLNGLASTVVPFGYYNQAPSVNPLWYQSGPRNYLLTERPAAH